MTRYNQPKGVYIMRKIVVPGILALLFLCGAASAANAPANPMLWFSGIYFGGIAGYADQNYDRNWLTNKPGFRSVAEVESNDYAGRIFLGYAFNDYYSLEAGYLLLQRVNFQAINGASDSQGMEQTVIDFTGKLTLPMHYIGLFVKAGGAYIHRTQIKITNAVYRTNNKYTPVIGGGLDVYASNNVTVIAECDLYAKTGDFRKLAFAGVGIAYQFS